MARVAPAAILDSANLVGVVTAIQDDPDSPDALWLTAASTAADSYVRVSFASPGDTLSGTQEFRVRVRKIGGSNTPSARIELWQGGALVSSGANTSVTSTTGVVLAYTWDGTGIDPAAVECRVYGTANTGGSASRRATIEVGAVEWNATAGAVSPVTEAWGTMLG